MIESGIPSAFYPAQPQRLEELGISESLVTDLMLRRLSIEGTSNLVNLSRALKVPVRVLDTVFRNMRHQQFVEVKGMVGNDYMMTLSGAGRAAAADRFQMSQYAGPAPVSLESYSQAVKAQAAQVDINRKALREALSDLIVTDSLLDQLGPAIVSQTSIFLYGPTGNGKTSLAERLLRVYTDATLMPYAVEVDGQIISLFDPVVHHRIEMNDPDMDQRWILCKRPCILVGGELVPNMLELRLDDTSGIYSAPLQMKANNGIFIIDDFGRQLISPRDLLNRWIVPLDRRVDYLALRYGVKFQIPFEVMVVFATNLDPSDLADEAFLRRIHNKIYVEPVTPQVFEGIFERVAKAKNVRLEPDSIRRIRERCENSASELRACFPTDICNLLVSIARYEKRAPAATAADLERAAGLYFAQS